MKEPVEASRTLPLFLGGGGVGQGLPCSVGATRLLSDLGGHGISLNPVYKVSLLRDPGPTTTPLLPRLEFRSPSSQDFLLPQLPPRSVPPGPTSLGTARPRLCSWQLCHPGLWSGGGPRR